MHIDWLKHATEIIEASGTEFSGDQWPSTEVTYPPAPLTAIQNCDVVHDTEVSPWSEMCSGADHDGADPTALEVMAFPV
jgi:L-ascorbate metabolism protein UlaG (beta-lactamase superfamily)